MAAEGKNGPTYKLRLGAAVDKHGRNNDVASVSNRLPSGNRNKQMTATDFGQ